ncbi:MAG: hypothetical protein Kow00120_21070 [Anaerolineae bacterium]
MLSGDSSIAQGRDGAFYQMLRRFSAHWARIDVICPHAPGAAARTLHGNVHVHPAPWRKALQPAFIVRRGRALCAERAYALIASHDFGFFYNGLGAWRLSRSTGVPYVSEIHHVEGYPRAATLKERVYRALAMAYIRWVWRRAAAIRVVNAVEMPELLARLGVPAARVLTLPSLYIDFATFHPMPDTPKQYDVAFVGRLAPNKGLFTLLDAVAQVRHTHPAVRLGILGAGPLRTALEARAAALGLGAHVAWVGRVPDADDVARFYNRARIVVCASTSEGGPRVTVEAMACGVPVISTPVGVMRELLEDGVNGLVWRWSSAELADKIRLLLDDAPLRARLAEAGRQSVQQFQADDVIARYARGYHALIRRLGEQG